MSAHGDERALVSRLRALGDRFRAQSVGGIKPKGGRSMHDSVNAARDASLCYEAVMALEAKDPTDAR